MKTGVIRTQLETGLTGSQRYAVLRNDSRIGTVSYWHHPGHAPQWRGRSRVNNTMIDVRAATRDRAIEKLVEAYDKAAGRESRKP